MEGCVPDDSASLSLALFLAISVSSKGHEDVKRGMERMEGKEKK